MMFTGMVDHCGEILTVKCSDRCVSLWVRCQFDDLQVGESIAIDGACLTVTANRAAAFACEISPETQRVTIAGKYRQGQRVNLERALRVSDRLGGHFVSGHVDQTIIIAAKEKQHEFLLLRFKGISKSLYPYLVRKGSIAINGVSLTINEVTPYDFTVMLIPHTLQRTNLATLQPGHYVNAEFDMVAKLINQQVQPQLQRWVDRGDVP